MTIDPTPVHPGEARVLVGIPTLEVTSRPDAPAEPIAPAADVSRGQVLALVSAKGGTGKTVLTVSLAYLLRRSGKSVVMIDTDFSTRGLGLFVSGGATAERLEIFDDSCVTESLLAEIPPDRMQPREVLRDGMSYEVIFADRDLSGGGEPDARIIGEAGAATEQSGVSPARYIAYLKALFASLRTRYDYILVDTRGGYDFTSAAAAATADGYVVVFESDALSRDQLRALQRAYDRFATEHALKPVLAGFVVNKAPDIDLRQAITAELQLRFGARTLAVIPQDKRVIVAYTHKDVPSSVAPESDFAYFSLQAARSLFSPNSNWDVASRQSFAQLTGEIGRRWESRRLADRIVAYSPLALLGAVAIALGYFYYYLWNPAAPLTVFYVLTATVVAMSIVAALFGTMQLLRHSRVSRPGRLLAFVTGLALVAAALNVMVVDVPRTFARDRFLSQIGALGSQLASEIRRQEVLKDSISTLSAALVGEQTAMSLATARLSEITRRVSQLENVRRSYLDSLYAIRRTADELQLRLTAIAAERPAPYEAAAAVADTALRRAASAKSGSARRMPVSGSGVSKKPR